MNTLSNDQLKRLAPSVFALEPWQDQSDKYRFIPTIQVIDSLRDNGFYPVKAVQSRSRIAGKAEFTKHMLRFRRNGDYQVQDILPEIVLINSHDGTSSYQLSLGLFRLVCSNGLTVADSMLESIRVTHRGAHDLRQSVIDASFRVIEDAPKALGLVDQWKAIALDQNEQHALAKSALSLYDSSIAIAPAQTLWSRRNADNPTGTGSRDLWKTYNVIQENLIKGGHRGSSASGNRVRTRAITSVDRDVKLNKALWELTAEMARIKGMSPTMEAPVIVSPAAPQRPEMTKFDRANALMAKYPNSWLQHIAELN